MHTGRDRGNLVCIDACNSWKLWVGTPAIRYLALKKIVQRGLLHNFFWASQSLQTFWVTQTDESGLCQTLKTSNSSVQVVIVQIASMLNRKISGSITPNDGPPGQVQLFSRMAMLISQTLLHELPTKWTLWRDARGAQSFSFITSTSLGELPPDLLEGLSFSWIREMKWK